MRSNIYCLYFESGYIKTGKANITQDRARDLQKHWGKLVRDKCFYFRTRKAYQTESAITRNLLNKNRLINNLEEDISDKDGYTEMLTPESYDKVKKIFKFFCDMLDSELKEGLPKVKRTDSYRDSSILYYCAVEGCNNEQHRTNKKSEEKPRYRNVCSGCWGRGRGAKGTEKGRKIVNEADAKVKSGEIELIYYVKGLSKEEARDLQTLENIV
jgi:hypothetical protein